MKAEELLSRVREAVKEIEPYAEVFLYGSRVRGEAKQDSDWDFLVLVNGPVDHMRISTLRHRLYELEWETGEILSAIMRSREEWDRPPLSLTPFHKVVTEEGVRL